MSLTELNKKGFAISSPIFDTANIKRIENFIDSYLNNHQSQKYAIRHLFKQIPTLQKCIFENSKFNAFTNFILNQNYFLTKSIYFNKPSRSNWFVPYHQDLSISVKHKKVIDGYTNWTKKNDVFGVQPPDSILQNTITIRIHLDNTNHTNGALKVIENSHTNGIIRIDKNFNTLNYGKETLCNIEKGAIMLMKPLTLHKSDKSVSKKDRRVIHLEFCCENIPDTIGWYESFQ